LIEGFSINGLEDRGHSGGEHALLARSLAPCPIMALPLSRALPGEDVGKIEIDQTFLDYEVH